MPAIGFLIILKNAGLLLACILAFIAIAYMVIALLNPDKATSRRDKFWLLLITLIIIPAVISATQLSWSTHFQHLGAVKVFQTKKITLPVLANDLFGQVSQEKQQVRQSFISDLIKGHQKGGWTSRISRFPISFIWFLFIFIGLYILLIRRTKDPKQRIFLWAQFGILLFGLALYIGGLLVLYLNSFHRADAINISAYGRYMRIYILALYLFIVYSYLQKIQMRFRGSAIISCVSLLAALFAIASYAHERQSLKQIRIQVKQVASKLEKSLPTHSKHKPMRICYVDPNIGGEMQPMLQYELLPKFLYFCSNTTNEAKLKSLLPQYPIIIVNQDGQLKRID